MKRIAAHTLGCKLNFAETSYLMRQFVALGYQPVEFHQEADVYIVNTCTVTAVAERKCRNIIRQAVATNPDAVVAVIGCFAQNAADAVARIPGVSLILGNDTKDQLVSRVENLLTHGASAADKATPQQPRSFTLAYSQAPRTRTFFKIQDGCDYFCTYCAIPFARGRSRSATVEETVEVARRIAAEGAREVVLTGVNTGTFGQQHQETLLDLVCRLDEVAGIERYRISSIEPNLLTNDLIDFVAQSRRFAHHFHVPLQAGSDKVLRLMNRRYTTADYATKVNYIRQRMPYACIAADLMVGFCGEDETEFARALQYVDSLPLSYLHVFTYSERPGTRALTLGEKIPMHLRRLHTTRMIALSEQKKQHFCEMNRGRSERVLWESDIKGGYMYGFTDNYIRMRRRYDATLVGQLTTELLHCYDCDDDVFVVDEGSVAHASLK